MEREHYQLLLRTHMEAENAHRMQEMLATLTQAFSTTAHPERVSFTDQGAVAEVHFQGTHVGSFLGVEPTGREVDIPTVIFVTFDNGLMAGERMYWDVATLLRQLGVSVLPTKD